MLKNPHLDALITIGAITIFGFIASLVTWGLSVVDLIKSWFFWVSLIFFGIFALIWLIILLIGTRKKKQIEAFLSSDRPLIRWTYSESEWAIIKERNWHEEHQDWKLQWGCLSFLFATAGGLTGAMLGWGEGLGAIIIRAIIGLLVGVGLGLFFGGAVAGGNHLASRIAYRWKKPVEVVLAPGEIFTGYDYFRADGRFRVVKNVALKRGEPDVLEFTLVFPPRPRMPLEETWAVPVPTHLVEKVSQLKSSLEVLGQD
jgi:hypothetical protein